MTSTVHDEIRQFIKYLLDGDARYKEFLLAHRDEEYCVSIMDFCDCIFTADQLTVIFASGALNTKFNIIDGDSYSFKFVIGFDRLTDPNNEIIDLNVPPFSDQLFWAHAAYVANARQRYDIVEVLIIVSKLINYELHGKRFMNMLDSNFIQAFIYRYQPQLLDELTNEDLQQLDYTLSKMFNANE